MEYSDGPASVESCQDTPEPQARSNPSEANPESPASGSNGGGLEVFQPPVQSLQIDPCWPEISDEVATDLINVYFDKVQAWLPLLHRPNFFSQYMPNGNFSRESLPRMTDQEALMFCGIFALAAGHSTHSYFADSLPRERGEQFSQKAKDYYGRLRQTDQGVPLVYLQGCILLVHYLYASGPCHQAWILVGVCVRLAYDLDLCSMDEHEHEEEQTDAMEWSAAEERRRAFWAVWEVDTFASLLSRRPSGINGQRLAVRLPVSDEAWFKNEPVSSPVIQSPPTKAWKTLLDSENQDARAWFLLVNYLTSITYQAASGRNRSERDNDELVESIICLSLAMHERFGLETHPLHFSPETFSRCNWIIGMHLMLNNARVCLSGSDSMLAHGSATCARDLACIIYHWHPEYIYLSHPFFAASLLPDRLHPSIHSVRPLDISCNMEMQRLILKQCARVWKLGLVLLGQ